MILNKLRAADPEQKKHCVSLFASFEHRSHLCLVFEPMAMNLRQVLKKYGGGVGISMLAVRSYCKQILISLKHMHHCQIIHADLKPDNILVSSSHLSMF
jgi:serine/threonine-protein kinase PRP4